MRKITKIDFKKIKCYSYFFKNKVLIIEKNNCTLYFKGNIATQLFFELLNLKYI
jgi:hypothetical protein